MTVWALANKEPYRTIGDRFGFNNRGMAHYCVMKTCQRIKAHLMTETVTWPSPAECAEIAHAFQSQHGFPGVVGCIDGSHIAVKAPAADRDSYINRKGFPSINLLAVCDHRLKFRFTFSDCPGSVHDARVFQESGLRDQIVQSQLFDTQQFHLLGDAAYPLLAGLLVPFRDNGHLTPQQIVYNTRHSSARCTVERAFGRLKGKFRRLKDLDVTRTDYGPVMIDTCVILHNIGLSDDFDETDACVDDSADEPLPDVREKPTTKEREEKKNGKAKRELIMANL